MHTGRILSRAYAAMREWSLLPAGCREAATCRYCFYPEAKNQHFAA